MRKVFFPLLVILLAIPTLWPFFQKGFFWTHDTIFLARIYAAANALSDGQFPLRWVSDFRYGEPLFNYYAPLPYYLGALVHFLGFDFITTAKIIFISITMLSALGMYLLAREYWGNLGGILSALLYLYAPYRAVDIYIRGAFSETFAFVWFPLIFWSYHQLIKTDRKQFLLLGSLFLALLILTHNIMALIFSPFLLAFLTFEIYNHRKLPPLIGVLISLALGLTLSATFWLPAFFEKGLVQTEMAILPLDNFVNQFVKPEEFIRPNWDGFNISHELGLVHLILSVLAIPAGLILWKKQKPLALFIFFLILLFLVSLFMQTIQSLQLWLLFSPLQFIQFPWRFAGISIFLFALLGGSSVQLIKSVKNKAFFAALAILVLILIQGHYFKPKNLRPNATDENFILLADVYLPKEYLPSGVKIAPPQKIDTPVLTDNYQKITTTTIVRHSNFYAFTADLEKQEEIVIPIYWFPGWKAFNGEQEISLKKQPKTGLILLSLPPGKQEILLKFTDTALRRVGNFISLFSLGATMLLFLIISRRKSLT